MAHGFAVLLRDPDCVVPDTVNGCDSVGAVAVGFVGSETGAEVGGGETDGVNEVRYGVRGCYFLSFWVGGCVSVGE